MTEGKGKKFFTLGLVRQMDGVDRVLSKPFVTVELSKVELFARLSVK